MKILLPVFLVIGIKLQLITGNMSEISYFPVILRAGVSQEKFLLDVLTSL